MGFRIYLSPPHMCGKELEYIKEAFDTNWVAPYGPSINAFESEVAEYIGVESALAVSSGTAGIHLALRWLGVEQGDYVFCSDFTFIGSCDAILYEKCVPVFIDSEPETWNMSPIALEEAMKWAYAQGKLPKAVIIVDLYGESADWDRLLPICRRYGAPVIEDAAEAMGTVYHGGKCGSFGDVGVFSFNGNKIITTSGGGMVVSNDQIAIEKMRFWATQARETAIHYEHREYGYNYRMSNICACIGRGQLKSLDDKIEIRKRIHKRYREALIGLPAHIKRTADKGCSNYWLNLLVIDSNDVTPSDIVTKLHNAQIEARPAWKPMHLQPVFEDAVFFSHGDGIGADLFNRVVCLPSGDGMTDEQIDEVVERITYCFSCVECLVS